MTDYEQLVKALRYCVSGDCENCSYFDKCKENGTAMDQLHNDAAAAIEDMAKHITEMHERVTVLQIARGKLEEEVDALKHDIARAIQNNVNLLSEFQQISAENMMLKADVDAAYRH